MLDNVAFVQVLRTPSSEAWLADLSRANKESFAQIDIHYLPDSVEATVTLFRPFKGEDVLHTFLNMIDEELISLGDLGRGNLRFRVIHGGVNKTEIFERPLEDAT